MFDVLVGAGCALLVAVGAFWSGRTSAPRPQASQEVEIHDEEPHQNVKFVDETPGPTETRGTTMDPQRSPALVQDATLAEFFSRPLKLAEVLWSPSLTLSESLDPWSAYMTNTKVRERMNNFKLMTATMRLKFVINGNAFYYGRAIAYYNPLDKLDDTSTLSPLLQENLVQASQRPHVYLNPTTSQGAEMVLPFFYPKDAVDLPSGDYSELGRLYMAQFVPLKHANGANAPINISIFGFLENVKLAIPTAYNLGSVAPQASKEKDEYGQGPVSRIAGAVANYAMALTRAPMIAPYARATEIGARAVGAIATLFGYSAPVLLETPRFTPTAIESLAVTNIDKSFQKLTMDAKQELSIDPRVSGLEGHDELDIKRIGAIESYLFTFPWTVSGTSESLIASMLVDPAIYRVGTVSPTPLMFPACAFVTNMFKYWRGTMRFKFQVMASNYHRGRLKIVYDPTGGGTTSEYNTAYTTIVDIAEEPEFIVEVGWGQQNTYAQHIWPNRDLGQGAMFSTTNPVAYTSPAASRSNGVLSVYIVNELTVPNDTINNDISVNVFVSMGDDFEVAVPNPASFSNLKLIPQPVTVARGLPPRPQASMEVSDSKVAGATIVHDVAGNVTDGDGTDLVYVGETIRSLRSVIKRSDYYGDWYFDSTVEYASRLIRQLKLPLFPNFSGFQYGSTGIRVAHALSVTTDEPIGYEFQPGRTTFLEYAKFAFAGWRGSVRYVFDTSSFSPTGVASGSVMSTRVYRNDGSDMVPTATSYDISDPTNSLDILNSYMVDNSFGAGGILESKDTNAMIKVEVPYYHNFRFAPGRQVSNIITADYPAGFVFEIEATRLNNVNINKFPVQMYVSGGEDFTLFFFVGLPPMYLYDYDTIS